jgi:SAM-dependent methyltransferase
MMKPRQTSTIVTTGLFYDSIAREYDHFMTEDDRGVRDIVYRAIEDICPSGTAVDFGGGTGLDLPYLSKGHKVFFIEPSVEMRAVAKQRSNSLNDIHFIDNNLQFENWNGERLPFPEKADLILMNFAVLNCISNLPLLFQQLALICHPGPFIIATILNPSPWHLLKTRPAALLKYYFTRMKGYNNYKGISHTAYIYKRSAVRKASSPTFEVISLQPVLNSPFSLLILQMPGGDK